jgi:hypothetical protein
VHAYERSWPLVGGNRVPDGQGPVYVVEGGGGAPLYDLAQPLLAFTAVAQKVTGYLILDVAPHALTLTARGLDGSVVDTYSLTK